MRLNKDTVTDMLLKLSKLGLSIRMSNVNGSYILTDNGNGNLLTPHSLPLREVYEYVNGAIYALEQKQIT